MRKQGEDEKGGEKHLDKLRVTPKQADRCVKSINKAERPKAEEMENTVLLVPLPVSRDVAQHTADSLQEPIDRTPRNQKKREYQNNG
eukprot:5947062-Amphidinium_carterae.1